MISSPLPELPWQKVGMDLFEWGRIMYLIIIDYYSRFIEVAKLDRATAIQVVTHCKSVFARHGIPEEVVTDNGSQFDSNVFRLFAQEFQFHHTRSSPYYPRGNGEAESGVKTVKRLLKKERDPYLALLAYRSTPLRNGYSPSELLMNRRLRTNVPSSREARQPAIPNKQLLVAREEELRRKQKSNFDRRHRARDLSPTLPGDVVWLPDRGEQGTVVGAQASPRSYQVVTPSGSYRRNRRDIIPLPSGGQDGQSRSLEAGTPPREPEGQSPRTVSEDPLPPASERLIPRRSGRVTYRPDRYDPCAG